MPWKYGFKGVKSIVRIRFVEHAAATTWSIAAPDEYGFYANVNPDGRPPALEPGAASDASASSSSGKTLPFNGYADQVAIAVRRHGPAEELLTGR